MAGRRSLAVVTALLVLLAGCSAFGSGVPSSDPADATTESGVDASVAPIHEPPLNTTDVSVDHVVALRKAGSFMYRSTVAISNPGQNATMEYGRIAHVEMDSAEMLVTRKDPGPGTQTIYMDGNGTSYVKTAGDSTATYNVTSGSFDTSRYAINGVPRFLDMFNLTYDGVTTLDGQEVYQYSADSPEQVDTLSGVAEGESTKSVSSISATLYIAKDGVIRQLGYTMVLETGEGSSHEISATTKYSGLGKTAVTEPSWTDDAEALASGEPRNVTRTITNESLGAELTLTADRTLFDRIRIIPGPGPLYKGNHTYKEAAVSSAVTPLIPPSAKNATITITYDESMVPEGGESELALYNYAATRNTWQTVNATHNPEANTFTFELPRSLALVVMHEPSWEETKSDAN